MVNRKLIIMGNGSDWCEKSLVALLNKKGVFFTNKRLPIDNKAMLKLARVHYSYKIKKYIKLPFKWIWYSLFNKTLIKNVNDTTDCCLLIYDRNILGGEYGFLNYIKRKNPNIKMAYIFTNIAKYSGAQEEGYLEKLSEWYDVVFAFDPVDAKKYNFVYQPLIYDADEKYIHTEENKKSKVFYVGRAKDRLKLLLESYERISLLGISTDYHVVGVETSHMRYADNIVYNKYMDYEEALQRIAGATCLIDIIQSESQGLTIKNCEAICYNKKLITTNKSIMQYPFYDSKFIKVIETADDIDEDFFNENVIVKYSEEGSYYFSGERFWNTLWTELKRLEEL